MFGETEYQMKYYVKKTGEGFHSEMRLEQLRSDFKAGKVAPDWSVRREDDGEYDWVTVKELCTSGRSEPTARDILSDPAKDGQSQTPPESKIAIDPTGPFVVAFGLGLAVMVSAPGGAPRL
jgi:hypothetical protein